MLYKHVYFPISKENLQASPCVLDFSSDKEKKRFVIRELSMTFFSIVDVDGFRALLEFLIMDTSSPSKKQDEIYSPQGVSYRNLKSTEVISHIMRWNVMTFPSYDITLLCFLTPEISVLPF